VCVNQTRSVQVTVHYCVCESNTVCASHSPLLCVCESNTVCASHSPVLCVCESNTLSQQNSNVNNLDLQRHEQTAQRSDGTVLFVRVSLQHELHGRYTTLQPKYLPGLYLRSRLRLEKHLTLHVAVITCLTCCKNI
jgi:hypothetical protein